MTWYRELFGAAGLFTVLLLSSRPSAMAAWRMNQANVDYVSALTSGLPAVASHAALKLAYEQAAVDAPSLLEEPRYALLPMWSEGFSTVGIDICPPRQDDFLFVAVLNEAMRRTRAEHYDAAEQAFSWLGENCPNNFDVFFQWAILKEARGDYAAGIQLLYRAVSLDPQLPLPNQIDAPAASWKAIALAGAFTDLGDLLAKNGQLVDAIEAIESALAIYPPRSASEWLYQALGILYYQTDQMEKARSALTMALEINPQLTDARDYLEKIETVK